ncbi:hypothetical protein AB1Y20_003891 [Prymnesium parvum]|uniref:DUF4515 domain-containing protein n=1 Tax=Prymnesium parvum TaxID=97485 RepID=A0AB34J7U4_PRYPA
MISDDVQRVELDARRRALEEYKLRCQDLRTENSSLKAEKDQHEADALQIISFLRRDAERKDELIDSLKNTIAQQREMFVQQRDEERETAAAERAAAEEEVSKAAAVREKRLQELEEELRDLKEFKERKAVLEEKLEQGEQERQDMEQEHKVALDSMERKFLEEKGRLQKEYKQMLAEMKKTSQEEAVERLDSSTKKILFENRRMAEELRLQVQETDELQKSKRTLEEENKKLRREVQLNEQSVKEYAKQGFRQSKEIKELNAKVKSLERSLSTSVREFEREKGSLAQADRKKIAEAELDSAGLRQLVRLKTKELGHIKRLATVILQKRNEVETFLLDSIETVKAEIHRRRAEEDRVSMRSKGRLPALVAAGRPSNLPTSADEHVDIRDLTWEDRERVLRLLFAKINNSSPFQQMPAHPLSEDDGWMQRATAHQQTPSESPASEEVYALSADAAFFVTQAEQA